MKVLLKNRVVASWVLAACAAVGLAADVPLDQNLVALFADLHCTTAENNPHQRAGLSQCVRDVLACNPRPANVLLYGDLAFNHGETNDFVGTGAERQRQIDL